MDPMTMMVLSGLLQAGTGAYRNIKAQRGLKELEKQKLPSYMDAAGPLRQNYRMADQQYRAGLSPAARGLALNTAASQRAQMMRGATELSGGQMSSALSRMGALGNAQMALGLGAQDQAARERGMQQMMGVNQQLSGLQQKDIGFGLQRRMEAERGYGQAIQDSRREMLGAATGLATGYLGYKNSEANRNLMRDLYGNKTTPTTTTPATTTPASSSFLVGAPNTFPGIPAGPPTFENYLRAGVPAGTSQTSVASYSPDFRVNQPMNTPFRAYDPNAFQQFTTPAMTSQLGGVGLQQTPFPAPSLSMPQINARGRQVVPDMSPTYNFGDTSGDPYASPNALKFGNPYRMNRGFMYSYDAVPGPFGQMQFQRN